MLTLLGLSGAGSTLLALAGGPAGLALAWLGSSFKSGAAKWIAIAVGLVLLIGTTIAVTVWIENLKSDRLAYRALKADVVSLARHYGCDVRIDPHERALSACLTARERDAADAAAAKLKDMQLQAAQAQAALDASNEQLREASRGNRAAIAQDAIAGDGPVPPVLSNSWARERAARGVK